MTDKRKQGNSRSTPPPTRRDFIKSSGGVLGLAAIIKLDEGTQNFKAAVAPPSAASFPPEETTFLPSPVKEDPLIRMQEDLRRAMQKPAAERHWAMVINLRRCVGCHACTEACISENKLPPGVIYRFVMDEEMGQYPNVSRRFTPRPCMHCDNPPCTKVCPVGATFKQPDGIVVIDYHRCIGCRFCIVACPYVARTMDYGDNYLEDEPEDSGLVLGYEQGGVWQSAPSFEYGYQHSRTPKRDSPIGNARKCHFCLHRLEKGMLPACVTTCIGRVNYFGDANDPDSLVSELIANPGIIQLKSELGTDPSVYYLF